jgi:AraC-like DNA-binding protein
VRNNLYLVLFNTHDVVLLITIYQCVILAAALFLLNRQQVKSGIFVTLFFLANAATPLDTLISFGDAFHPFAIEHIPDWFYVFEMGYWLEGPFLLWYLRSLVYKDYRLRLVDLWYLTPFLLFFCHQLIAYHSMPTVGKIYLERTHNLATESVSIFFIVFLRAALRVYFGVLCLQEMHRYFSMMHQKFANFNDAAFLWVKILVYGFLAVWVWGLFIAAGLIFNNHYALPIAAGVMGLVSNYVICFLLGAILVSICIRSGSVEQLEYIQVPDNTQGNLLVDPNEIEYLESVMREKKLFLDPNFNLEDLANTLGWSPRALSSLINRYYECSFYEFVNKYRIEEAKILMLDEKHKSSTILDIMYEVGFNSKTTFNGCFKKYVGITPREFKKKQLEVL